MPATLLFLGANPSSTTRLALDREAREIGQRLRASELRDAFRLEQAWAVRATDLQECLLRYRPTIVHFSGHGSSLGELCLDNAAGQATPVKNEVLTRLFHVLRRDIRCVVLNACFSEAQARAISTHIDCVIGMNTAINDDSAIAFAGAFYQALGYGEDVRTAFDLGCLQIDLAGMKNADAPRLLLREGVEGRETLLSAARRSKGDTFETHGEGDRASERSESRLIDSTEELLSLLKQRAARVLEHMEDQKREGLASIRSGKGYSSEAELLERLGAIRQKFLELHEEHIRAIGRGQLTFAHELVKDIHTLLWIQHGDIFWASQADRGASYRRPLDMPERYAGVYPGSKPVNIALPLHELSTAIWPERWDSRIELQTYRSDRIRGDLGEPRSEGQKEFEITKQSLIDLKLEGVPDDVLGILASISGQRIAGDGHLMDTLSGLLGHEQANRFEAAIQKHAEKRSESALSHAIEHGDWATAAQLGALDEAPALKPLIIAIHSCTSRKEADAAASALAQLNDARAVEPLIALVRSGGWKIAYAANALAQLGDARAVEPLISALQWERLDVRPSVVNALGRLGDARAMEPVRALLTDERAEVRYAVAKALDELGSRLQAPQKKAP
ncbi:HEAT repeat domain-containing protein [Sorangium sp. So ce726]|uniref:HEAT repeat domain-containing protein n=1 Tax=Sorangium sp. So ce726 TaxID=3133319 RepID=UPI003F6173E5